MRSKFLPALLVAVAAMFLFSSCKKNTNTQGRYVPATAAVIVHVNAAAVMEKLPWEEVKQGDLFRTAYTDSSMSDFAKAALDNPENTGIDSKKDFVFFMVKDSSGSYVAFEGAIKDAAKFKAYNSSVLKNSNATQKDGTEFLSNEKTTVSWNKDRFIVVTDAPTATNSDEMQDWMKKMDQKMADDSMAPMPMPVPAKSTRNGVATATQLFALSEDNSMAKNEKFSELVSTKGDMHFWINAELLQQGAPQMPQLSMVNLEKMYEGSIATGAINFENGRIDVDMKSYAGKDMLELWKKYAGTKISDDMVKRLPAKNVALFLAMNFKPEGIKEFLKLTGLDGFVNLGAGTVGFNLDDFIKANKGDIVLSLSDITKDTSGKTSASVLFSTAIGDKPSFDKLVAAGKKLGSQGMGKMASQIYFNSNEKYFTIGNNKTDVDQFVAKEGNSKFDFYEKIESSPIAGYVNFQYIMNSMRANLGKDSVGSLVLDSSLKVWDNALMSGGNFKDGGITQHFEINMMDKSTNSLKQLNRYMGLVARIAKENKKEDNINEIRLPGNTSPADSAAIAE